jgi:hypothetical protein
MATNNDTDTKQTQFDAGLAYIMKDYFAKLQLTYTVSSATDAVLVDPDDPGSTFVGDVSANALQLGFQIQQ